MSRGDLQKRGLRNKEQHQKVPFSKHHSPVHHKPGTFLRQRFCLLSTQRTRHLGRDRALVCLLSCAVKHAQTCTSAQQNIRSAQESRLLWTGLRSPSPEPQGHRLPIGGCQCEGFSQRRRMSWKNSNTTQNKIHIFLWRCTSPRQQYMIQSICFVIVRLIKTNYPLFLSKLIMKKHPGFSFVSFFFNGCPLNESACRFFK